MLKKIWIVVVCLFLFAHQGEVEQRLQKVLHNYPEIEKVQVFTDKEAEYGGKQYSHLIVFTVNPLFHGLHEKSLDHYLLRLEKEVLRQIKVTRGLMVFQDQYGKVYLTVPLNAS